MSGPHKEKAIALSSTRFCDESGRKRMPPWQHQSYRVTSSSSASSEWRSETIADGKLLIAKKTSEHQKKSTTILENKIWALLNEFKEDAPIAEIDRYTAKIMKAIKQTTAGQSNKAQDTLGASGMEHKMYKSHQKIEIKRTTTPTKSTTTFKSKHKVEKKISQKKSLNHLIDDSKLTGQKVPVELMNLLPSDGFVDKPPRGTKRTPKPVIRFSDTHFQSPSIRRSATRRETIGVKNRRVEKNGPRTTNAKESTKEKPVQTPMFKLDLMRLPVEQSKPTTMGEYSVFRNFILVCKKMVILKKKTQIIIGLMNFQFPNSSNLLQTNTSLQPRASLQLSEPLPPRRSTKL